MVYRIVVVALLAEGLVFCTGWIGWTLHVLGVDARVSAAAAAAGVLFAHGERRPVAMIRAIISPGLHVIVEDQAAFEVFAADSDGFIDRRSGGASRNGPYYPAPADGAFSFPLVRQFSSAGSSHVGDDTFRITISPSFRDLRNWLIADVLTVAVLTLGMTVFATVVGGRFIRAERSRLEAAARERQALAAEYQRFLADAGHELRTPLTIVSGYVDILTARLREANSDLDLVFSGAKAETARMRALVEKMLLLARLETPMAVPRLVDAGLLAEQIVIAMRVRFPSRHLDVVRDGPAMIVIDEDDLDEALRNVIENALKHAPDSPVRVEAGSSGGHAFVAVSDQGPGVAASDQHAIFERFYRGAGRKAEGSGLGLAIVRRVAHRWKGSIELSSRPAHTVFTLRFPLADEER
jgi:signal transduction histidine kinase